MYDLIVAPMFDTFIVVRPGSVHALRMSAPRYAELTALGNGPAPGWLVDAARQGWSLDLRGPLTDRILIRHQYPARYVKASWEIDLACNWACPHCYLGSRPRGGLEPTDQVRLLRLLADAGVLWLQITGGEPTTAEGFSAGYAAAWDLGMMITLSTNGSRLDRPDLLRLLTARRPHRIRVSLYGADESTYQTVTGRRRSWQTLCRGLEAACGANLPVELKAVVTTDNVDQVPGMQALAREWGLPLRVFPNLSPTLDGGAGPLRLRTGVTTAKQRPFTGCRAGRTSLHVDPDGQASICKIARDMRVDLIHDGLPVLGRLAAYADVLLNRTDRCADCAMIDRCPTCPPLVRRFRTAGAPPAYFCPLEAES